MGGSEAADAEGAKPRRAVARAGAVRDRIRALPGGRLAWRIGITVVGVAVIAGGIILLPLPGPGWLIIFAGLGLLGTEYRWAKRLLRWVRRQLRRWTAWVAQQPRWVQALVGLAGMLLLAAIAAAAWFAYR
ncbi:MAG TPA: TIGR02611 family protein [Jatrophihabitans sp.]|nr:TIGR02611 family protein [Jatrophihabitans sp.]